MDIGLFLEGISDVCISRFSYDRLNEVSPRDLDKSHSNYRQGGREGPSINLCPLGYEFDPMAKKLISLAEKIDR